MKEGKFPSGKSAKNLDKKPVTFGALEDIVCYACGQKAHKAGDPNCKAGPYEARRKFQSFPLRASSGKLLQTLQGEIERV